MEIRNSHRDSGLSDSGSFANGNTNIAPLLKGKDVTDTGWTGKEQAIQEDCLWGVGPEALYQITRAEYKTEPDSIKVEDSIRLFTEFYMPKEILTIIAEISSGQNNQ